MVVGGDSRQLIYVPWAGATATAPAAPPVLPADIAAPSVNATGDIRPERSERPSGREEETR